MDENRYMIENIDATIIAQRPKMRPYIDTMRQNIADAPVLRSIRSMSKRQRSEGLGLQGDGEGISSQAICAIEKYTNYSSTDVSSDCGMCGGCCSRIGEERVNDHP